jgi:cyclophilin family peptidyl-prolyl cis-trans isomerase
MWSKPIETAAAARKTAAFVVVARVPPTVFRRLRGRARLALAAITPALLAVTACGDLGMSNPAPPADAPRVAVETDRGTIVIALYVEQAPITTRNFLEYVDASFYDGTLFHRVIADFMIQGGGYVRDSEGRLQLKQTRPPIPLEADNGLRNYRGAVAMARLPDGPDTGTSQFFVNLVDNQRLDRLGEVELGYAVFGVVVEGMDVVDEIAGVATRAETPLPGVDVPVEDVVIRSVRRRQ